MAADSGASLDSSKCTKLSMEEKRELVYEISKWPESASEILQSWSRQEILQILCAEMGKERKYTGLTKLKMIENLLKIVSEKKSGSSELTDLDAQAYPSFAQKAMKRQKKSDHPSQTSVSANEVLRNNCSNESSNTVYCKNSACKATLSRESTFCKRCSCCICHQYDDNKDPSLWLTCSSEPPFQGDSCGMSCHLECALKHEHCGIARVRQTGRDGNFYCVSCGKVNDLLGCWRKQLMLAKETRRVDILCYRISLSRKLLYGTEKYQKLNQIVDEAAKKLEAEVGPITGVPVKISRGIVNRLSSGAEVQKLCASAVESLDSMLSNQILHPFPNPTIQVANSLSADIVRFEDVDATHLTIVLGSKGISQVNPVLYTIWHCKALDIDYPEQPTCALSQSNTRFVLRGLTPSTKYRFKVVSFDGKREVEIGRCEVQFSTVGTVVERSQSHATNSSDLSNPSSVEDETNNVNQSDTISLLDEEHATGLAVLTPTSDVLKPLPEYQIVEDMNMDNGSNSPVQTGKECGPPITPCKLEILKDGRVRSDSKDLENGTGKDEEEPPQDGSTSKKRSGETRDEGCTGNDTSGRDFEYYVKVIRWLECEGQIEKKFRQKFLTWYSLRATAQQVKIVKVFVDTFIEDPASLAEQLVDTFTDCISCNKPSVVPAGFCMKLWH